MTRTLAALAVLISSGAAFAQGGNIYSCHALDGSAIFQDRPCNQAPGTREARSGSIGTLIPNAAPPADDDAGAVAARYQRYLDQVATDRREQTAADDAETARLRAAAELEAARAPTASSAARREDCYSFDSEGRCLDGEEPIYSAFIPYWQRPVYHDPYHPPGYVPPTKPIAEPPPAGPRPTRPPPRVPRDVRAEILRIDQ